MLFRRTAAVVVAVMATSACGSGPELSKAASAKVVRSALAQCDVARARLEGASPQEVYHASMDVESECQGATLTMMRANLPEPIKGSCRDASESARVFAGMADTAANDPRPDNLARQSDAMNAAESARQACEAAIS